MAYYNNEAILDAEMLKESNHVAEFQSEITDVETLVVSHDSTKHEIERRTGKYMSK